MASRRAAGSQLHGAADVEDRPGRPAHGRAPFRLEVISTAPRAEPRRRATAPRERPAAQAERVGRGTLGLVQNAATSVARRRRRRVIRRSCRLRPRRSSRRLISPRWRRRGAGSRGARSGSRSSTAKKTTPRGHPRSLPRPTRCHHGVSGRSHGRARRAGAPSCVDRSRAVRDDRPARPWGQAEQRSLPA